MIRKFPLVLVCVIVHGIVWSSQESKVEVRKGHAKTFYGRVVPKVLKSDARKKLDEVDNLSERRMSFLVGKITHDYASQKDIDISDDAVFQTIIMYDNVLRKTIEKELKADRMLKILATERRSHETDYKKELLVARMLKIVAAK